MKINKNFFRGQTYCITNEISDVGTMEDDKFFIMKNDKPLTVLVGIQGNITGEMHFRFEPLTALSFFLDPMDRLAITDAIAYLEERYKTP